MSMMKQRLIEKLPDDYTLDEIMAEMYFKQQVEEGLRIESSLENSAKRSLRIFRPSWPISTALGNKVRTQ